VTTDHLVEPVRFNLFHMSRPCTQGKPDESNTMFFIVHLVKGKGAARAGAKVRGKAGATPGSGLKWPKLKACIYKRR